MVLLWVHVCCFYLICINCIININLVFFFLFCMADVSQADLKAACALGRSPGHRSVSCGACPCRHWSPHSKSKQWAVPLPSFASTCRMEMRCRRCSCTPTTPTCRRPLTPTVPMATHISMKRRCITLHGMAWKHYYGTVEFQFPSALLGGWGEVYLFRFEDRNSHTKERGESCAIYW